ncbi:hypothetical protein [Capnocytophaga sp. oral taxon 338]|uniref:hypothetical protein n=1 Tax=Capnocytophaga sp. oral taxon 338 TaxID=710239 RepID=UPI000202B309|nr:hypothetical protein [Capnocytophaga sp. oral taxon 338]EGD34056.1 hypothetical protein HMPREF9071_1326 [Capnocytophaga sp. oral taxon 338 str. F0234]
MSRYIFLLGVFLLMSCQKKQIQLPQVQEAKITQIEDYSEVYIFYEERTGSAKLNPNGLISSTHWVFHIDKRNTLGKVAKYLIFLQEKKRNPRNPHHNPNSHNYWSVADIPHQRLGFIDFTENTFLPYAPQTAFKESEPLIFAYPDGFRLKKDSVEKRSWEESDVLKNTSYTWIFSGDMSFQQFIDIYDNRLYQSIGNSISPIYITDIAK